MQATDDANTVLDVCSWILSRVVFSEEGGPSTTYTPAHPTGQEAISEFNNHYGFCSFMGHGGADNVAIATKGYNNNEQNSKYKLNSFDWHEGGNYYIRTNYGTDKNWVSDEKNDEFKYTLIHSTPKGGTRYMYSSRNDNGHFGVSKVIFGDSGIGDVIIDMKGDYGMTQHSMAIIFSDIEEANNIKKALLSNKFNEFLKTVMWSNFQIDWRLFSYLKKDFWKEFI
ncbi:MAG: hypothetical protein HPY57_15800 [Ignavibacteria bacterium]|nr:hypothetical protein [Ignavibacteria bacterium]